MTKDEVFQIKMFLDGIEPKIWRRFQVQSDISFHKLHGVIQTVMGWTDSHLYEFEVDGKIFQDEKSADFSDDDNGILASGKQKIRMLKLRQKFGYLYDFGDGWEHVLTLEKVLSGDTSFVPFCIEGERNCPPEDCGSYPGYYHMMKVRKNKKHPEYSELIKDWLGEDYDPEHFDVNEVNFTLQQQFLKKGFKKPDGRARYWVLKIKK